MENNENNIGEKKRSALDVALIALSVLAALALLFSLFFMTVKVKQTSMLPTLKDGQIVLGLKIRDGEVERGDIVVYKGEEFNGDLVIKRVVAIGGDTLEITEDGAVKIIDKDEVDRVIAYEAYVLDGYSGTVEKITLKENEVYLLGDNRAVSHDSRSVGAVEKKGIVCKIILPKN